MIVGHFLRLTFSPRTRKSFELIFIIILLVLPVMPVTLTTPAASDDVHTALVFTA
jgi:hypothetical protein